MNWVWYIPAVVVFGLLLLQLLLQHWLEHGSLPILQRWLKQDSIPIRKRKGLVKTLFWLTLLAFIGSKVADLCKDYQNAKEAKESKRVTTSLVERIQESQEIIGGLRLQVTNLTQAVQEFTDAFETNNSVASPLRLGKLTGEEKTLAQKQLEVSQKVQTMNSIESPDLKTLREARTNRYALHETERQQAEIKRRKSEIVKKETGEQLAENFRKIETHLTEQCLSVFDDVIGILFHQLVSVAKDAGEKVSHDFSGQTPSIKRSNLVREGRIIPGTNFINLGMNAAWNFQIAITNSISVTTSPIIRSFGPQRLRPLAVPLQIMCNGNETNLSLIVEPTLSPNQNSRVAAVFRRNLTTNIFFDQVSVGVNAVNETSRAQASITNYTGSVKSAIAVLLQEQDAQFPLKESNVK